MRGSQQRRSAAKGRKQAANKRLGELESDVSGYEGRCLFVTDDDGGHCDRPVSNNCHIVSESTVLDRLKDDKTKRVLELQWGVSQWRELLFKSDPEQLAQDPTTFDPSERITRDACMGRFACKLLAHDDEFQPIDVAEPDFDDPIARFLSGYRLMLFVTDQYRQSIRLLQRWEQRAMRNSKRGGPTLWLRETKKRMEGHRRAISTVKLLERTGRHG